MTNLDKQIQNLQRKYNNLEKRVLKLQQRLKVEHNSPTPVRKGRFTVEHTNAVDFNVLPTPTRPKNNNRRVPNQRTPSSKMGRFNVSNL